MKKILILLIIIVVVGTLGYLGPQNHHRFEHEGVLEEIHHRDEYSEANNDALKHFQLDTSNFIKVHSKSAEIKDFFTQFRADEIISFPCQNCHNTAISNLKNSDTSTVNAHWDIRLNHASAQVMNCSSCHQKDNLNSLKALTGEDILFDESFKLCGQCHSTQYKDWEGGAHGKNLNGWQSTRLVKTCVNCHNPHDPAIKSRWPSRLVSNNDKDTKH